MESSKRVKVIFTLIFLVLFIFVSFTKPIIGLITNYLWFSSVNYKELFTVQLFTKVKIFIPVFFLISLVVFIYLKSLVKNYFHFVEKPLENEFKRNKLISLVFSIVFGFMYSLNFTSLLWMKILMQLNKFNFGYQDPIFHNDVSFYIYTYPLMRSVLDAVFMLAFWLLVTTVMAYLILIRFYPPSKDNIVYLNPRNNVSFSSIANKKVYSYMITKVTVIGSMIFVLFALSYYLKTYELLFSSRGVAYGASYTDINVTLVSYRIQMVIALVSSVGIYIGFKRRSLKLSLVGPVLFLAVTLITGGSAMFIQKFVVEPDEISKETKFLEYNIENTQRAYNLDKVVEKEFPVDQDLTKKDIEENSEIVDNIRINDYRPLKQTYNQIQGIRLYYKFNDIDIDRYQIDGKYTEVFISAREMEQNSLDEKAQTWLNKHLIYTHGYGAVVSPVNKITQNGQPELLVKNLPPTTNTDLKIERPELYFGELNNDYIVVKTGEEEFDYPSGSDNKRTIFNSDRGIPLAGINKLLFSIEENSLKMLLSNNITKDSKIIIHRNIVDRLKTLTPFIQYDENPYLVINKEDGKLYWIADGYTTSTMHPYSQPYVTKFGRANYIRNSVKAVVDAYSGEVNLYVFDKNDPLIKTYSKIFKNSFKDKSEMDKYLFAHVKYPQDLFELQARVYKSYHVNNPTVFYNGEDVWDIATEKYMSEVQDVESNYLMFKLPDSKKLEFLLSIPFTPKEKANMNSLLIARNDGDNYGKIVMYRFPKDKNVQGPMMIESRIDQNSEISPQLTLWGQQGSSVLRGNILVIPINNSLLYIEPIYLQADNSNNLPELKRVIIAYKEKIVMEDTLEKAIDSMFSINKFDSSSSQTDYTNTDTTTSVISDASLNELLIQVEQALNQSKGDIDKLEELINVIKSKIK
ncbi:UPF0182 family protein [Helicovermis profundi]|uniref:UPF0182 protein HLPR_19300 n=2 Tax=Helicovermis profundi TaxID=3065157 RepID=A0AAU9EDV7_9FIRM|nr:UPF0182 family protein [Clostridia bacterium S502]